MTLGQVVLGLKPTLCVLCWGKCGGFSDSVWDSKSRGHKLEIYICLVVFLSNTHSLPIVLVNTQ